jgi:DNA topoisomerase VI subunit B
LFEVPLPLSPLQKRILELSSQILSTDDVAEFKRISAELKAALREHAQHLRSMVEETKKRLTRDKKQVGL